MIKEITSNIKILFNKIKQIEIRCFLSNDNDTFNSYLEFHAGAGGTESQDWADMLRRMYMKWFDKNKYRYEIISEHKGDEAGIDLLEFLHLTLVLEDIQVLPVFGYTQLYLKILMLKF